MTPCLLWDGAKSENGYGRLLYNGKLIRAHRLSYEMVNGPIPKGLVLDHLCRVRDCINPEHLEAVTSAENTLRGVGTAAINARKTQCKNGHPFDMRRANGRRLCRKCYNAYMRLYKVNNRKGDIR